MKLTSENWKSIPSYHPYYLRRSSFLNLRNEIPSVRFKKDGHASASNSKGIESNNSESIRLYFSNYCDMATLHGFKYFAEPGRPIYERCFWLIAIIMVMIGMGITIRSQIIYYVSKPIMMTLDSKQSPVWEVPFPAITICTANQARLSIINITDLIKASEERNLTNSELTYFALLTYMCRDSNSKPLNFLINESHLRHFNEYGNEHAFKLCKKLFSNVIYRGKIFDEPCKFMQITTNPSGFCHSFNMFPPKSMYTKTYLDSYVSGTMSSIVNQNPYGFKDASTSWTPDNGYTKLFNSDSELELPLRVTSGSTMNSVNFVLDFGNDDFQETCRPITNGFLAYIHSPMEWPSLEQPFLYVDVDKLTGAFVEPRFTKTDESLRGWTPEERGCYYNNERRLLFFKYYSLNNCNMECDANYTLQMCNCNVFFQPHLHGTPLCGLDKIVCYRLSTMATTDAYLHKSSHFSACNCLPSCNELKYKLDHTNQPRNWTYNNEYYNIPSNVYKLQNIGNIFVTYKTRSYSSYIRTAIMLPTDFIANIGGLLGLFLGFSCISVFEIVYFALIRWIADIWNKNNQLNGRSKNNNVDEKLAFGKPTHNLNIDSRISFSSTVRNRTYLNNNYLH